MISKLQKNLRTACHFLFDLISYYGFWSQSNWPKDFFKRIITSRHQLLMYTSTSFKTLCWWWHFTISPHSLISHITVHDSPSLSDLNPLHACFSTVLFQKGFKVDIFDICNVSTRMNHVPMSVPRCSLDPEVYASFAFAFYLPEHFTPHFCSTTTTHLL